MYSQPPSGLLSKDLEFNKSELRLYLLTVSLLQSLRRLIQIRRHFAHLAENDSRWPKENRTAQQIRYSLGHDLANSGSRFL
jgi:hypothetical protein